MKIFHFLQALNHQLKDGAKEKDKFLATLQKFKKTKLKPGQIEPRSFNVFKKLCYLGITEFHMSRHSVELLKVSKHRNYLKFHSFIY